MFDVQPYIDKLEKLKEYISYRIDQPTFWVNLDAIPKIEARELFEIFMKYGIIIARNVSSTCVSYEPQTFEQFLETKSTYN